MRRDHLHYIYLESGSKVTRYKLCDDCNLKLEKCCHLEDCAEGRDFIALIIDWIFVCLENICGVYGFNVGQIQYPCFGTPRQKVENSHFTHDALVQLSWHWFHSTRKPRKHRIWCVTHEYWLNIGWDTDISLFFKGVFYGTAILNFIALLKMLSLNFMVNGLHLKYHTEMLGKAIYSLRFGDFQWPLHFDICI